MRVALDAMGGDLAPGPVVAGAVQAVAANPDLHITLVGDSARIEACLPARRRVPFTIFPCAQVIEPDEVPLRALRRKPDNSISRGWQFLAENKVDAFVSAGPADAIVAAGLRLRRFLKPVRRPGLVAVVPTRRGPCVLIDVGANPGPRPQHLFQYGVMGSLFAEHVLQRPASVIGLLHSGECGQRAETRLGSGSLRKQFLGKVDGLDVLEGACDVAVCDGCAGKLLLQTCQGAFAYVLQAATRGVLDVLDRERSAAEQALKEIAEGCDASAHGGSLLLGVDGIAVVCPATGGERAVQKALELAVRCAQARLNERIVQELEAAPAGDDE
jgi:glycerol-3-phosphate acyltransferase PlsX